MVLEALGWQCSVDEQGRACRWSSGRYAEVNCSSYLGNDVEGAARDLALALAPELPRAPPVRVERVQWEPILKTDRGGVVGALDLIAYLELPIPTLSAEVEKVERDDLKPIWELPEWKQRPSGTLFGNGKHVWFRYDHTKPLRVDASVLALMNGVCASPSGSCRLVRSQWRHQGDYKNIKLLVEAKTTIRSAGELLRQMNLYRGAVEGEKRLLVVAPASAWVEDLREILREQNICTLTYLANS